MELKKFSLTLQIIIFTTPILLLHTHANEANKQTATESPTVTNGIPVKFSSADLSMDDIRVYVGRCPSQVKELKQDNQLTDIGILPAIAGQLIDTGINALGNLLVKAGSPKDKTFYSAINLNSLNNLGQCIVIIDGKFSMKNNPLLMEKIKDYQENRTNTGQSANAIPSQDPSEVIANISPDMADKPTKTQQIATPARSNPQQTVLEAKNDGSQTDGVIMCDIRLWELSSEKRQKLIIEKKFNEIKKYDVAKQISQQTEKSIDGLINNSDFDEQKQNIKNALNDNCIQLAEVPRTYLELQIIPSINSEGKASAITLSPLVISFQKPRVRNSFGFYTGKRDFVVSASMNSLTSSVAVPKMLLLEDMKTPSFMYFEPLVNKTCLSQKIKNEFPFFCGGVKESPWLKFPDSNGPYRLEIGITETRQGNVFVKTLGEVILNNKEQIGVSAKNKFIDDYKDQENQKKADQYILDQKAQYEKKKVAYTDMATALADYKACKQYNDSDQTQASLLLLKYNTTRANAELSFNEAKKPDGLDFNAILPVLPKCPN